MWLDLLDHWQTFAAGVLTVGAAFIAGVCALICSTYCRRATPRLHRLLPDRGSALPQPKSGAASRTRVKCWYSP
jgi:hypothetical protein